MQELETSTSCRVCPRPILAHSLCKQHLTAEHLVLCSIPTCHRAAAPQLQHCAVHQHLDNITTPWT